MVEMINRLNRHEPLDIVINVDEKRVEELIKKGYSELNKVEDIKPKKEKVEKVK